MRDGYSVIKKPAAAIVGVLGQQKFDGNSQYHISTFSIKVMAPDGILYHSCLTGEMIIVRDMDSAYQYLVENWMYVSLNLDEKKLVSQIKRLLHCLAPKETIGFKTFEIITTTVCNAQCYYCYEAGFKHMTITNEISQKIIEYIRKNKQGDSIKLKWYGGEPLMNIKAIDTISRGLIQAGISFCSTMISNGVLFSENVISKAKDLWKLRNVRITIDGTESVYNKTKNYKNKLGSPYQLLLLNIDNLLKKEISVTIRVNIEKRNIDDAKLLIEDLCKRYQGNELVDFMLRPLNNTVVNTTIESSGADRDKILQEITMLKKQIFASGFLVNCGKLTGMTLCSCIADSGTYIAIKPNGELAYCSSDFNNKTFGSIYEEDKVRPFPYLGNMLFEKKEICYDCQLYPICSPSKLCPACIHPICGEAQKKYNIEDVKLTMEKVYNLYKKNK